MTECWKPIPGYEGAYEVSDLGNVRSLDRTTDRGRRWKGRVLTPATLRNGYLTVSLWRIGVQCTPMVHRLVLAACVGPCPEGREALHANGNRADNRLVNLSWGTHSKNQFDQVSHGTHPKASKSHCPSGHPYDIENTYVYPNGRHRACRICRANNQRVWKATNPERARQFAREAQRRSRARRKLEAH